MDWLSNLFGGLGSALGGASKSIGGAANSIGGGLGNLMSMFGGGQSGSKTVPGSYGGSPSMGAGMGASMPSMSKGGGGMFSGNPMGAFGMGAGALGLGQLLGGKTKAPNLQTPQMSAYQNFTTNPPQLPQSMQDEINKSMGIQQEQESRNLRDVYKNLRPGTDYTTDSAYQRDLGNLQRNQASSRANAMMGPTLQYLQPMQQSLADQAQMSMYQPMLQYGQQTAQNQATKQMFGNMGSMFMENALWPQLFSGFRPGGYNG